jgi:hypothetical protein
MALKRGVKVDRGYATISEDDGVNYRNISATLTEMGYKMNHSSALNYVLRSMKKFAEAYARHLDIDTRKLDMDEIVRSPDFQGVVADVLTCLETERREIRRIT